MAARLGANVGIGWIPPSAPVEEALDNPWPAFDPWMKWCRWVSRGVARGSDR